MQLCITRHDPARKTRIEPVLGGDAHSRLAILVQAYAMSQVSKGQRWVLKPASQSTRQGKEVGAEAS